MPFRHSLDYADFRGFCFSESRIFADFADFSFAVRLSIFVVFCFCLRSCCTTWKGYATKSLSESRISADYTDGRGFFAAVVCLILDSAYFLFVSMMHNLDRLCYKECCHRCTTWKGYAIELTLFKH